MSLGEPAIRGAIRELDLLRNVRQSVIDAVVDAFIATGKVVSDDPKTVLLNEGDGLGNTGFVLVDGTASVTSSEGVDTEVSAPALFGEMQQFSISGTRSATVRLETESTVVHFDWTDFYTYLESNLKDYEVQSVRDAIREQSWQHFLASESD